MSRIDLLTGAADHLRSQADSPQPTQARPSARERSKQAKASGNDDSHSGQTARCHLLRLCRRRASDPSTGHGASLPMSDGSNVRLGCACFWHRAGGVPKRFVVTNYTVLSWSNVSFRSRLHRMSEVVCTRSRLGWNCTGQTRDDGGRFVAALPPRHVRTPGGSGPQSRAVASCAFWWNHSMCSCRRRAASSPSCAWTASKMWWCWVRSVAMTSGHVSMASIAPLT